MIKADVTDNKAVINTGAVELLMRALEAWTKEEQQLTGRKNKVG